MSEQDLDTTIKISVDASGVEAGTTRVKRSLNDIGKAASDVGAQTGSSIGAGGDEASKKIEAAARRISNEFKRLQVDAASVGKTLSEKLDIKADAYGIPRAIFADQRASIKAFEDAQRAANPAMVQFQKLADASGQSVKGLSAALRQVPAQFTDIVVSLQGGQAPLTVLLQQGGQLKDVFGGVAPAAKALGGYVLGLINPFTVAAAAAGTLALAYLKGAAEGEAYNKAIITTGNSAGVTAGQLGDMAKSVAAATGGTVGAAAEALAGLAGSTGIASAQFEKIAAVAIQMEKVTGVAVADTVKQFAELGKDPVGASLKLTETTKFLTFEVYEQIKALENQGQTLQAGALAQKAYADALENRIPALADNLGILEKAWKGIVKEAKQGWDSMLGIGRENDAQSQLAKFQNQLANAVNTGATEAETKSLETQVIYFQRMVASQGSMAAYTADRVKQETASIALAEKADKFASKQVLMQREIAKAQADFNNSKRTDTDNSNYVATLTGIAKKYEETAKAAGKGAKEAMSEYDKLIQKLGQDLPKAAAEAEAAQHGYNKAQTEFLTLAGSPAWAKFTNAQRANVAALYENKIASEQAEDATKTLAKATLDAAKSREKYLESMDKGLEKIQADIAAQISATERMGLSKEAIADLDAAKLEMMATDIELQAIKALDRNLDEQTYEALKKQAKAYRDLAIAKQEGGAKAAGLELEKENAKAAKEAAAEWKKTSDNINSTLTDALMRGFESGKDFARNLRDTVVNMFKTMVLRPIISAVMNPIAQGITGAMGLSGAASAASTGSSLLSAAGAASSIYSIGTTIAGMAGTAIGAATGGLVAANAATVTLLTGSASSAAAAATAAATAGGAAASAASTAAAAGSSAAASLASVALPALAAVAVLAAFGAFRSTKQTGTGIKGTLGDDASLTGFDEMRKSGYLFGGPKYWDEIKAIDPLMAKALKTDFANIKIAATGAADALGLAATEVAGYSKAFRIEFTGDKAKDEALYKDLLNGVSEDLAKTILGSYKETITTVIDEIQTGGFWDNFDPTITKTERQVTTSTYTPSEFARDGETASQTLQRLATSITLVNATSNTLGNKLLDVGLAGANTASLIADAFGGLEAYANSMGSYYQNFYTQSERTAKLTETTSEAFAKLGLVMPTLDEGARAAYRALVDTAAGQDMTIEANRKAYASLLALQGPMNELAPTFDSIAQSAADAASKMADAWASIQDARLSISGASAASIAQASIDSAFAAYKAANPTAGQTSAGDFLTITQADFATYSESNRALIGQMINGFKSLNNAATSGSGGGGGGSYYSGGSGTVSGPDYAADLATAKNALSQARTDMASSLRSISDQIKVFTVDAANAARDLKSARDNISNAYFQAADEMLAAEQKVIDLQKEAADGLTRFAGTIDDFLKTINPATGGNASTASLKALLSSTSVLAGAGDTDAQGKLLDIAQRVLKSAEASSTSRLDYARSEAFVRSTLVGVRDLIVPPVDPLAADESGMVAVVAAVVTPLQAAQDALLAAQLKVVEFSAAAAFSGANTDRATRETAMSSQALLDAFVSAQAASTLADSNLAAAQSLTGGLLVTSGATAIAGLISTIGQYGAANDAASAAMLAVAAAQTAMGVAGATLGNSAADVAGTLALTDTAALALATSLGLTGTSAAALAAMLTNPATASEALAAALGLPGSNAQALADKLGLSGTAAASFIAAVGNSATDFASLFGANSSMAGSLSALTALLNTSGLDINGLINSLKPTGLDAGDIATHLKTAATALGNSGLSGALTLSAAQALAFEAAIKNSGLTVGSLQLSLGNEGLAGAANSLGLTFGPNGTLQGNAASLAALLGSAGAAAQAFATLVGGTQIVIPSAVTANQQAVTNAYGAIGRKGFGSATNQVDQAGYDYWLNELETGMLTAATFQQTFLQAVASNTAAGFESAVAIAQASLTSGNKLPGFAVGTSYVPHDMTARIHQGEEITPRPYVDRQASDRNETNALLSRLVASNEAMKAELALLRQSGQKTEQNTEAAAKTLNVVTRGGRAIQTEAFV